MNIQSNTPKSIFLDALVLPEGAQRQNYLAAECGGDAALRAEVESLIAHHQQLGTFLESSPPGATAMFPDSDSHLLEGPGSIIGPYKLSAKGAWASCSWPSKPSRCNARWR
jgi:eukaryotic-like serine/threonine-protein kinase